jgi:hypothetical protein
MQGGVVVDRAAVLQNRAQRDRHGEGLKAAVEKIQEYDASSKISISDWSTSPPCSAARKFISAGKWANPAFATHGVDEGFAGRKPIGRDFLDNDQGDLAN